MDNPIHLHPIMLYTYHSHRHTNFACTMGQTVCIPPFCQSLHWCTIPSVLVNHEFGVHQLAATYI